MQKYENLQSYHNIYISIMRVIVLVQRLLRSRDMWVMEGREAKHETVLIVNKCAAEIVMNMASLSITQRIMQNVATSSAKVILAR